MKLRLKINGKSSQVTVDEGKPLLWVLREDLHLIGPKYGCGAGLCGACTVLVDGVAIRSCITPVEGLENADIVTIEGIGRVQFGADVQNAWNELNVTQCGYCQSGQMLSAVALLNSVPDPQDTDIKRQMSGHICRCGTYPKISAAIKQVASQRMEVLDE